MMKSCWVVSHVTVELVPEVSEAGCLRRYGVHGSSPVSDFLNIDTYDYREDFMVYF
jgi:hypothetical protein